MVNLFMQRSLYVPHQIQILFQSFAVLLKTLKIKIVRKYHYIKCHSYNMHSSVHTIDNCKEDLKGNKKKCKLN
ncbi:hypothetical protein PGABG02_0002600 [Plasmodium sp. DRC-Itaito]|nr:hypothetical protein PGABG02_0002600 [Plasmodium sp. DRC-Itaito]